MTLACPARAPRFADRQRDRLGGVAAALGGNPAPGTPAPPTPNDGCRTTEARERLPRRSGRLYGQATQPVRVRSQVLCRALLSSDLQQLRAARVLPGAPPLGNENRAGLSGWRAGAQSGGVLLVR